MVKKNPSGVIARGIFSSAFLSLSQILTFWQTVSLRHIIMHIIQLLILRFPPFLICCPVITVFCGSPKMQEAAVLGSGFLQFICRSESCNRTRCGFFPHHTHHITNSEIHLVQCSVTKVTTEKISIQIKSQKKNSLPPWRIWLRLSFCGKGPGEP